MTVLNEMNTGENVSELEKDLILNFLVKESIEIANEEIDYFFETKFRLVSAFVSGLELKSMTKELLQERFNVFIYSDEDISYLVMKIAKGIKRELSRGQYHGDFQLEYNYEIIDHEIYAENLHTHLAGDIRTLKLSDSISKAIDITWKKTSQKLLPKELLLFTQKFSISSYFLGAAGVSPQTIKEDIKGKMSKILRGIIKQQKIELKNGLRKEIIKQLLAMPKEHNTSIGAKRTKTA